MQQLILIKNSVCVHANNISWFQVDDERQSFTRIHLKSGGWVSVDIGFMEFKSMYEQAYE